MLTPRGELSASKYGSHVLIRSLNSSGISIWTLAAQKYRFPLIPSHSVSQANQRRRSTHAFPAQVYLGAAHLMLFVAVLMIYILQWTF